MPIWGRAIAAARDCETSVDMARSAGDGQDASSGDGGSVESNRRAGADSAQRKSTLEGRGQQHRAVAACTARNIQVQIKAFWRWGRQGGSDGEA